MKRFGVLILVASLGACGGAGLDGHIQHGSQKVAVVDSFNRDFHFDGPSACDVYVSERIVDEEARYAEFDVKLGSDDYSIVYSVNADDKRPLHAQVLAGSQPTLVLTADAHDLDLFNGDAAALSVTSYDDPSAVQAKTTAPFTDAKALSLLACSLPARSDFGAIPAFLRNLASGGRDPSNPDVSQTSAATEPLLPKWDGKTSLLGTYLVSGVFSTATGDWSPHALDLQGLVGVVVPAAYQQQ